MGYIRCHKDVFLLMIDCQPWASQTVESLCWFIFVFFWSVCWEQVADCRWALTPRLVLAFISSTLVHHASVTEGRGFQKVPCHSDDPVGGLGDLSVTLRHQTSSSSPFTPPRLLKSASPSFPPPLFHVAAARIKRGGVAIPLITF